ncbi:MAG: PAS domain S-box protein [Myxococcota bacterium]
MATDTQQLERLFSLSLDLLCIAGTDGYFRRVNPRFREVLGYTDEEILSRPFLELVHPDDVDATNAEVARIAAGARTIQFENRYRRRDGTWCRLSWNAAPAPDGSEIYAIARDVTEGRAIADRLVASEAQLRAVVDAAVDGIVTIDPAGCILTFNPAAERMFGWTAAEVRGANVRVLMPEPYRSEHDGYLANYHRTHVPRVIGIGREVVGRRKDGTDFPLDLAVAEVPGQGFVGLLRDLTEQKREEAVRNAALARDAWQQGRIEMSSGILHDLGNALTGIAARAVDVRATVQRGSEHDELLRKTHAFLSAQEAPLTAALGERKAGALVALVEALARNVSAGRTDATEGLTRLLAYVTHAQELLTTHRTYSGAGSGPSRERLDVRKLFEDARLLLSDAIAKREGTLTLTTPPAPCYLHAERARVMQVLVNLLKNAVEACDSVDPPRRPALALLCVQTDGGGGVLRVTDNGGGFDAADAARLFEDGFTTKARGSGLGLGSARRVVASFGGRLSLASPGPGRGAIAEIHLPREVLST